MLDEKVINGSAKIAEKYWLVMVSNGIPEEKAKHICCLALYGLKQMLG